MAIPLLCEREGIPFELRKIRPEEIERASEVFASTTAGGVMPVTRIDGKPIGNGHAGIVTSRIQQACRTGREAGRHGVGASDLLAC